MSAATCSRCRAPVTADDRFCESCGFPLQQRRAGTAEVRAAFNQDAPCADCGATESVDGFCAQCGARRPDGTDHFEADLGVAVLVSDVGKIHSKNEDGVAAGQPASSGSGVAAVVCDGISSVSRPELASTAASEAALDELLQGLSQGVAAKQNLIAAAAAAAKAVAALDDRHEHDPPACTFVAAVVTAGQPHAQVSVGWIGDSRGYWLATDTGSARRLTDDDSWAGEIVRSGTMNYDQAMRLPQAHAITRWLGSDTARDPELVRPHVVTFEADQPGALLLCSDGLWNYLPDAAPLAEKVWAAQDLMTAARDLNQFALDRGGDDNITLVLVDLREPLSGPPDPAPAPESDPASGPASGPATLPDLEPDDHPDEAPTTVIPIARVAGEGDPPQ